jgi:hypothetical protein
MNILKLWFFKTLARARQTFPILQPNYRYSALHVADLPDKLEKGRVYVVGENGHHWSAGLKCPGGCGNVLEINLVPDMRPLWHFVENPDGTITIEPSIWRKRDCECHFRITNGRVRWY